MTSHRALWWLANSRLGGSNFARGKITISQFSATTNAYLRPQRELLTIQYGRLGTRRSGSPPLSGAAFIYTFALPPVGQCLCRSSVDGRGRDHSLLGQHLCLRSPHGSSGVLRSRWCVGLSIYATTMAIMGAFTMVLVASTPLFLPWPVAFFCVFHGTILSVSMGSAPMAFYSWHAMET